LLGLAATGGTAQSNLDLFATIDGIEDRIALVNQLIEREDARLEELGERMDTSQNAEQRTQIATLHERLTHKLDQLEDTRDRLAEQLATLRRQAAQLEQ